MRTTTTNARPSWLGIYPATPDIYSDTPQAPGDRVVWEEPAPTPVFALCVDVGEGRDLMSPPRS